MADPSRSTVPIPYLTSELIHEDISTYYLEWLEEIDRAEATKAFLAKKARDEAEQEAKGLDVGSGDLRQHVYDHETALRRKKIFDKINKRRSNRKHGSTSKNVNYDSVVSEYRLYKDQFDLFEIIGNFFRVGRKLKPIVQHQPPSAYDTLSQTTLKVHVIRAQDVPIRDDFYKAFSDMVENEGGQQNIDKLNKLEKLLGQPQVEPFVEVRIVDPDASSENLRE